MCSIMMVGLVATTSSAVASSVTAASATVATASTTAPSTSAFTPAALECGEVDALVCDLELTPLEVGTVELDGIFNGCFGPKFDVCETLRTSRVLVAHDRDALHSSAGLKVRQQLFRSGGVIHLSNVNGVLVLGGRIRRLGRCSRSLGTSGIPTRVLLLQLLRLLGYSGRLRLHARDLCLELLHVIFIVFVFGRWLRGLLGRLLLLGFFCCCFCAHGWTFYLRCL
mmetsp:Transcript_22802/g.63617  ORF Transcript_22802/g.63617 Transcript_22802/m.63617 type:complete len:225 (-) Transcript_22802:102-776(-)